MISYLKTSSLYRLIISLEWRRLPLLMRVELDIRPGGKAQDATLSERDIKDQMNEALGHFGLGPL